MPEIRVIEFDARLLGDDPKMYALSAMAAFATHLQGLEPQRPVAPRRMTEASMVETASRLTQAFALALYGVEGRSFPGQCDQILDLQNVATESVTAYARWSKFCADCAASLDVSFFRVTGINAPPTAPQRVFQVECNHFCATYTKREA